MLPLGMFALPALLRSAKAQAVMTVSASANANANARAAFGPARAPARQRCRSSLQEASSSNLLANVHALRNDYVCLRHGQSLANVAAIIASNPRIACEVYGLSPVGHKQAAQAGLDVVEHYQHHQQQQQQQSNKSYKGLLVLSSDLLRAAETARYVEQAALAAGVPLYNGAVVTEIRLRERWFGDYDETADSNYPNVWKDDAIDPSHEIAGVESVDSVMGRATAAVLEWDALVENHCVLCVAHGDVLQILQTAFNKMDGRLHRTLEHLETAKLRAVQLAD